MAVHRAQQVGAGEALRQFQRLGVQREHPEEVAVHQQVVGRRERSVVAPPVTRQVRVAGEPAGEVVEPLAATARTVPARLATGGDAVAEGALGDLLHAGRDAGHGPVAEMGARQVGRDLHAFLAGQLRPRRCVRIQAQQGEGTRALRCAAPGEVRAAVGPEADLPVTALPCAKSGRNRAAVAETVAADLHGCSQDWYRPESARAGTRGAGQAAGYPRRCGTGPRTAKAGASAWE